MIFAFLLTDGQDKVLKVWPNGAPNDNGIKEPEETFEGLRIRKVSETQMYI